MEAVATSSAIREGVAPGHAHRESVWLIFGLATTVLLFYTIWDLGALRTGGPKGLQIFGSFWESGWAAAHGLNPYASYPLTFTTARYQQYAGVADVNLNPPALLPLFQALSLFAPDVAVKIWTLLSAGLFIGSAALLVMEYESHIQHRQVLWALLALPVFNTLAIGQIYSLIAALAIAAWILLERNRQIAAGICLGLLVAAKPNYALWALLLVFCGRTRAAATAGLVAVSLASAPLMLYGPGVYGQWLHAVSSDSHWMAPCDVSLAGLATRMGHRRAGEGLACTLLLFSCGFVAWKRPSPRNASGIALSVAMLSSPLAWVHYSQLLAGPLLRERWGLLMTLALFSLMPSFPAVSYFLSICVVAAHFFWWAAVGTGTKAPLKERQAVAV